MSIWKFVVELNKFKTSYDYDKEDRNNFIVRNNQKMNYGNKKV